MTEADFVLMLSEYTNRSWVLQTWFVSVSMALFTVSYLVGRKISLGQLLFILLTYVLYVFAILRNLGRILDNITSTINSLLALKDQGIELSPLTTQLFESYPVEDTSLKAIIDFFIFDFGFFLLMFFGAIGYVIYQYRSGKKSSSEGKQP